jgi:hypothetical protein
MIKKAKIVTAKHSARRKVKKVTGAPAKKAKIKTHESTVILLDTAPYMLGYSFHSRTIRR